MARKSVSFSAFYIHTRRLVFLGGRRLYLPSPLPRSATELIVTVAVESIQMLATFMPMYYNSHE